MKTFFKIVNGFVQVCQCDDKMDAPQGWTATENHDIYKYNGRKREWFEISGSNISVIEESERIKRGIQFDKRGTYYNKENREEKKITVLDEDIDEEIFTKEVPIENEPFQFFDKQKNTWVIDSDKKELAEKQGEVNKIKYQITDAESRIGRSMRSVHRNRAAFEKYLNLDSLAEAEKEEFLSGLDKKLKDDFDKFKELDNLIEIDLRPELNRLEEELKSA